MERRIAMDVEVGEEVRGPGARERPVRPYPFDDAPRFLRRLRWPLTAAFLAVLAAIVALATLGDSHLLDLHGEWLTTLLLILGVSGVASWEAPPRTRAPRTPRPPSRRPRM